MPLPTETRTLILAAVAAFTVGVVATSCWPEPEPTAPVREWRQQVAAYEEQVDRLAVALGALRDSVSRERARADSAEVRAQRSVARAARAEGRVDLLREELARDTTVRDSVQHLVTLVAQQDTVITGFREALAQQQAATARLRGALTTLTVAHDSLTTAHQQAVALLRQGSL